MAAELEVHFNILVHPYLDEPGSELEAWGQILIHIIHDSESHTLLDWQWDILAFGEWYAENADVIFGTTLPNIRKDESLAEALERMNDRDFLDHEEDVEFEWHSRLYEFRRQHSLRVALKGVPIPNIIIGCNRNQGEISLSEQGEKWTYSFDIKKFRQNIKQKLQEFLIQWYNIVSSPKAKERASQLLREIETV